MKGKKIILIFIIVTLFAVAISTTIFVYFKNKKNNSKECFDSSSYVSTLESSKNMRETRALINELKASDSRFNGMTEAVDNIDIIVESLAVYSANVDFKIQSSDLVDKMNESHKKLDDLHNIVNEYNIKKASSYFDKKLGANDLIVATCSYICSYSNFALSFIDELKSGVVQSSDLNFAVYDLYLRVLKNDYSVLLLDPTSKLYSVDDLTDVNFINAKFGVTDGNLQNLSESALSKNASLFCLNYNNADKEVFSASLFANVKDEIELSQNSSDIEKASYYFRKIYGI